MKNSSLIRPLVRELHPYVYGEQPKIKGLIKLNTNENPFPPSPKVLRVIQNAAFFMLVCAQLIQGCARSSTPGAARQKEFAAILKPFLKSTEVGWGEDAEVIHGWANPTNQQALRIFISKYPETEEAYEAEIWLSMATAPPSTDTFQNRRIRAEMADRLKAISQTTSQPGTKKMAELERAFVLYQDCHGNHAVFYWQVDDILDRIQDFQSERSKPFRLYLHAAEMSPSEIEPTLRFLVVSEKCIDCQQSEALVLAKELKQKYPNWDPQSVNSDIEMLELYQCGWPRQHGSIAQE